MWTVILAAWVSTAAPPQAAEEYMLNRAELTQPPRAQPCSRVGHIFISGNVKTPQSVILSELKTYPGYPLDLREIRLARLGRFKVDLKKGIRPRVTILASEDDNVFKDILVEVVEK
jgi:hypothetical protein